MAKSASENAELTVPDKPVVGVVIAIGAKTVSTAEAVAVLVVALCEFVTVTE